MHCNMHCSELLEDGFCSCVVEIVAMGHTLKHTLQHKLQQALTTRPLPLCSCAVGLKGREEARMARHHHIRCGYRTETCQPPTTQQHYPRGASRTCRCRSDYHGSHTAHCCCCCCCYHTFPQTAEQTPPHSDCRGLRTDGYSCGRHPCSPPPLQPPAATAWALVARLERGSARLQSCASCKSAEYLAREIVCGLGHPKRRMLEGMR
mmetsp:Transcript_82234/g.133456  ORF Transcript_82234/g.133456 Transcript_82234/m.133456 type:complete len:206 (-) Transcript_82234:3654-4271(-)